MKYSKRNTAVDNRQLDLRTVTLKTYVTDTDVEVFVRSLTAEDLVKLADGKIVYYRPQIHLIKK